MCGEQLIAAVAHDNAGGSPPRVRGTEKYWRRDKDETGITPACAGNSVNSVAMLALGEDHPRVCGEQPAASMMMVHRAGSPPRVRGTA